MKKLILILCFSLFWHFVYAQQEGLLLKSPSNGQTLSGGTYFNITWEYSNVENIKIEYSADAGNTWSTVVASYPASAGFYPWLVPVKPTTNGKIKISNAFNAATASLSTGTFSIAQPQLNLDVDTTAVLVPGNVFQLKWNSLSVEKINLYYSIDGGTSFVFIAKGFPALASAFSWIIPEITQSQIRIKIESVDDATVKGIWDSATVRARTPAIQTKYQGGSFDGHSTMSNAASKLELISPKGGENLASFSSQSIQWNSYNIEFLKIEFSADSGITWSVIKDSYPAAAQSFDWKVPATVTTKGLVRLTALEPIGMSVKNPTPFRIPSKSIAIDKNFKPNYELEEPISIYWVNNGIENIDLSYKKVNETKWTLIKETLPASMLQFVWIPPTQLQSDSILIKITAKDFNYQDSTAIPIAIRSSLSNKLKFRGGSFDGFSEASNQEAKLKLNTIKEGTILDAFGNLEVGWTSSDLEFVDIYYSKDGKQTWTNVVKDFAAKAKQYQWQIPYAPTKAGFLKIVASQDTSLHDVSPRFEISESYLKLEIDTLLDGQPNSVNPIRWIQSGLSDINISIKRADTSKVWTRITSKYQAAANQYIWVNPNSLEGYYDVKATATVSPFNSDSVRVRFNSANTKAVPDKFRGGGYDGFTSRGNVGKILVTKPQAGEMIIAGTTYLISWKSEKVADSVKIEYTTDNGKTWKIITAAVDAKSGLYSWQVPSLSPTSFGSIGNYSSELSASTSINECRIRISELNVADALEGMSNNTFKISSAVVQQSQTISFDAITAKQVGDQPFVLKARSSANLPISFSVESGPASIKDSTLTITGIGLVKVKASQSGNNLFTPAADVYREFSVEVLPASNFKVKLLSATCRSAANGLITIKASKNLPYKATLKSAALNQTYDFSDTLSIKDLSAGKYNVCIRINGISNYEQCYELAITEPADLAVYTQLNLSANTLTLNMTGSETYFISINDDHYTSNSAKFNVPLKPGLNKIKVNGTQACQGVYEEEIYVNELVEVYPNPFSSVLNIKLEGQNDQELSIKVLSSAGLKVYEGRHKVLNNLISLDLANLERGYYFVLIGKRSYKIIKQ